MAKPKNKNKNRVKPLNKSNVAQNTKQDVPIPEGLSPEERAKYQAALLPKGTMVTGMNGSLQTEDIIKLSTSEVVSINYYCETEDFSSKHYEAMTSCGYHRSVKHFSKHDLKLLGIPHFVPGCHEPGLFVSIYEEIQRRYNPTFLEERLKLNLFDVLYQVDLSIAAQFTLTLMEKKEESFQLKGSPCLPHYYEQVTSQLTWPEVKLHFIDRFRFFTCKYDYLLYLDECLGEIRLQWGKHRRFFNHVRGWLSAVERVQKFTSSDRTDVLKAIFLLVPYDRQYFCMPEDIDIMEAPFEKRVGDCLDAYEARCDYLMKEFDTELYDSRVAAKRKPPKLKVVEIGEMEKCVDIGCPGSKDSKEKDIGEEEIGCPMHEMDDYVAGISAMDGKKVCLSLTKATRNPIKLDLDAPHCHVHIGFSGDSPAMKALVSTGTFACCIRDSTVSNLGLAPLVTKLKAAEYIPSGGGPLRFESVLTLPLWFPAGHLKICRFVIVENLAVPMIIGSDFVHYHDALVTLRGFKLGKNAPKCPSYMRVVPTENETQAR